MDKISDFPKFVFKAFTEEKHAMEFMNEGRFRIGNMLGYRTIEDELRKDSTEGEASYQFEEELQQIHYSKDSEIIGTSKKMGLMSVSGSWGNPTYIFCTSLPDVDLSYLKERFGKFIVQINDSQQFMSDMQEALLKTDHFFIGKGFVRGRYVDYSKGGVFDKDKETVDSCELATYQKPPEFSLENEYRFIAMMSAINPPEVIPDYLELVIGRELKYVQMC